MIHLNQLKLILGNLAFELENDITAEPRDLTKDEIFKAFMKRRPEDYRFWVNELEAEVDAYLSLREAVRQLDAQQMDHVALHVDKSKPFSFFQS